MATEIKIPIPDQTTEEVRVVKWRKAVGDAVATGEVVLEVETDKSVIEVEAVGAGTLLKQLYDEDAMVPVGQVVGYVGQEGEAIPEAQPAGDAAASKTATAATPAAEPAAAGKLPAGAVEVKIPIPDQTTEEVRVVKWRKSVGDAVATGEVVLEVETDKSVIEVEAVGAGVLLVQGPAEDEMVPVGQVVGVIGPEGAQATLPQGAAAPSAAPPAAASSAPAAPAPTTAAPAPVDTRIKASPIARKTAAKLGVDLAQVKGSGPNGRIVKEDVERFAAAGAAPATAPIAPAAIRAKIIDGRILASPNAKRLARELDVDLQQIAGSGPQGRIVGADVQKAAAAGTAQPSAAAAAPPTPAGPAPGQPQPGTEVATTKMRRAIAVSLQKSSRDTPHFNVTMSVNMTRALAFRTKINAGVDKGRKVSVNDLVVKACAVALTQYPSVNSRFCDETIKYMPQINIGVATAVPDGLVVPVLTEADKRDWYDMAAESKRLATAARQGKILNAGKGTFTVSNLGMFGVEQFTGIINPPEAAILTVGAVQDAVVAVNGMIGVQPIMKITLCSDHRVIDGALAAEFCRAIKVYLEDQIA